ncbi:DUF3072 domain-containing protein [Oceaniovalibus sp. ACAM 378]|uniref:DUF3072 domain-containing protein n=1 Tax=Oceaniovalibus sp. ACAM 378 TaxID=2599923 RepID=UPI0016529CA0|nr:DUF3072 domain-containing protein [Oceaniovalibus sp. ACAM 378]
MPVDETTPIAAKASIGAIPVSDPQGSEPMTIKQSALLRALCNKRGEKYDDGLTRAEAQELIDTLRD